MCLFDERRSRRRGTVQHRVHELGLALRVRIAIVSERGSESALELGVLLRQRDIGSECVTERDLTRELGAVAAHDVEMVGDAERAAVVETRRQRRAEGLATGDAEIAE